MDKTFLMGNNDFLTRNSNNSIKPTYISAYLNAKLRMLAIKQACEFYSDFFNISISDLNYEELTRKYEKSFSNALSFGLFEKGGVGENDHLNLWCISHVFKPKKYIESGVHIGSSLHAFIDSPNIDEIFAIDPKLSKLKIPVSQIPGGKLIDDKDFSQIKITVSGKESLVYFDDHINTANRIIEAYQKGFKYILFDDSTGLEKICKKLYPPIPTIPMIMNYEELPIGEELSWSFNKSLPNNYFKKIIEKILGKNTKSRVIRVSLTITQELLDLIPPTHPNKKGGASKFLLELN